MKLGHSLLLGSPLEIRRLKPPRPQPFNSIAPRKGECQAIVTLPTPQMGDTNSSRCVPHRDGGEQLVLHITVCTSWPP